MKYLKKVDFIAQSMVWLILIVVGLGILPTDKRADFWILALVCQFGLGCWQMVSSLTVLILKADSLQLRKIHFGLALLDLLLLAIFGGLENSMKTTLSTTMILVTGVFLPWCLAIFYYYITWRWVFPKRNAGKFLSHVSF